MTSRCVGSALITSTTCTNDSPRPAADTAHGLAPKTIAEVHMIVRAALDDAVARELVSRNVAHHTRSRRRPIAHGLGPILDRAELSQFLTAARPQRLYPALHLAAHTGMRRGEIVGLKWSDLDAERSRLSISRSIQNVGGRPIEFGVKTRTSRRTVELDHTTRDAPRPAGVAGFDTSSCRTTPMTGCSATRSAASSTPNRSPSCSIASCNEARSPASGSTTCACATRRHVSGRGERTRLRSVAADRLKLRAA